LRAPRHLDGVRRHIHASGLSAADRAGSRCSRAGTGWSIRPPTGATAPAKSGFCRASAGGTATAPESAGRGPEQSEIRPARSADRHGSSAASTGARLGFALATATRAIMARGRHCW
jgi:hypothetical protein